jgi:hypothetical protein
MNYGYVPLQQSWVIRNKGLTALFGTGGLLLLILEAADRLADKAMDVSDRAVTEGKLPG